MSSWKWEKAQKWSLDSFDIWDLSINQQRRTLTECNLISRWLSNSAENLRGSYWPSLITAGAGLTAADWNEEPLSGGRLQISLTARSPLLHVSCQNSSNQRRSENMLSRNLSFFSSAGGKRKPEHVRTRVTHSVRAAAKQLQQLLNIDWGA